MFENRVNILKKNIMRRVRFIYFLRRVFSAVSLKLALAAVFLVGIASFVSVRDVIMNMPDPWSVSEFLNFTFDAFIKTETMVQIFALATFVFLCLLARDLLKNLRVLRLA